MFERAKQWAKRLGQALQKTSLHFHDRLRSVMQGKTSEEALEALEELLLSVDLGVSVTKRLLKDVRHKGLGNDEASLLLLTDHLSSSVASILAYASPSPLDRWPVSGLRVIMVCGVNGNGKTTTIAKLSSYFQSQSKKVMLAACDSFRAAATDQLLIWSDRLGVPCVTGEPQADPSSIAYRATQAALDSGMDVLLIDTAGRLHSRTDLMDELAKMRRVVQKLLPEAPHDCWIVLDATTGQNALNQMDVFRDKIGITGLIVTKLDGTARGGVVVGLADRFRLPIVGLGTGESLEDFESFDAKLYAEQLFRPLS